MADGAVPSPGSATLTGPQAFAVGKAVMVATSGPHAGDCNDKEIPAGVTPLVQVLIAEQGVPNGDVCISDAGVPEGGAGSFLVLAIATPEWAKSVGDPAAAPLSQSLVAGTYTISNEHENDEDPCMLQGGGSAYLYLSNLTATDALSIAMSGTVTLESVSAGAVAGRFDVVMGGPYGTADASPPPSLSGSFNATACP